MAVTRAMVKLEAPELECESIDSDVFDQAISQAALEVNVNAVSAARGDRLMTLLVAHRLSLWVRRKKGAGGAGTPTGALTSVSVGGVSKSFADPTGDASYSEKLMAQTHYGREFIRLRRLWAPRGAVS